MDAISAEWIFPVTSPPLHRHAIEIKDGRIHSIRPQQPGDLHLTDTAILPGLVNSHTHLGYTALRNLFDDLSFFPWIRKITETKYQKMTEADVVASTMLGIHECLSAGITTVADMSDMEPALKALADSPLRGIFYWEIFGVEKEQAEQAWTDLQKTYPRLKKQYTTEKLRIGISPHAVYTVRPELYTRVSQMAFEQNIPISFHLAESKEEEQFIEHRAGVIQTFLEKRASDWQILGNSSIAHAAETGIFKAKPLLAHAVQATSRDIDILQKFEVYIAHCPKSNSKFGHGIAPIMKFLGRGIPVSLGTDSAASNNRLDLFEEARFAQLQQKILEGKSFTEQQLLEMITIRGAKALGMDREIGSLEKGKYADLVGVKIPSYYVNSGQVLNHLIYNATAADVSQTFVSGESVTGSSSEGFIREFLLRL
jgi:cytosine/adenosine deaminase-related metal-dependent hydrolase